jgi:hypothetical protein
MRNAMKWMGASALVMSGAFGSGAALAQDTHILTLTCGDFVAMEDGDQLAASHDLLIWINESANSDAAGAELIGRYGDVNPLELQPEEDTALELREAGWTRYLMKSDVDAHCIDQSTTSLVIDRLKEQM